MTFYDDMEQFGDLAAFILEDGETLTYADAAATADSINAHFSQRELVFILTDNSIESVLGYLGCLRCRVPVVLLAKNIHSDLLSNLLKVYSPRYIWLPRELTSRQSSARELFTYRNYVLLERESSGPVEMHRALAVLMTTSGSTGSSKFVRLSYGNLTSNAASIAKYLEIGRDDRAITTLPMHYVYGLSVINSHLESGATIILTNAGIMERRFWKLLKLERATSIAGVPHTYEVLRRLEWHLMELPSLRVLTQAGGKLSGSIVKEYARACVSKGMRFYVMYGAAEATARMSYLPPEIATEKPSSIGTAIPGGAFWLEDETGTVITRPEVVGELFYRGANVSLGYSQCRADLALGDERLGVLKTGDMAKRDKDGMYFIVGRKSRFVKLFGNRVNLDELEQLIRDAGIDCACKGDDEMLKIYITAASRQNEVVSFVENLTNLHNSVLSVVVIDEIPRNEAGKILYSELP